MPLKKQIKNGVTLICDKKVLALIPARSGSKGLPGKNIRILHQKPLIAWSIEAAKNSFYIDDLLVSTDSQKIADIAIKYGAEAPFLRPSELASDNASSIDVILHAVDWLAAQNRCYEIVVLLEPTSPLREPEDINRCLEMMQENRVSSVVSVSQVENMHPMFLFHMGEEKKLHPYSQKQPNSVRRQDIKPLFFLDGSVYCSEIDALKARKGFYHEDTSGYVVPKWKSLEIDDEDDFVMVEALMKIRLLNR